MRKVAISCFNTTIEALVFQPIFIKQHKVFFKKGMICLQNVLAI
jgi:hypothetical protein